MPVGVCLPLGRFGRICRGLFHRLHPGETRNCVGLSNRREFEIDGVSSVLVAYTRPSEHSDTDHTLGISLTIDIEDRRTDRAREIPIAERKVKFLLGGSTDPAIVADVKRRVAGKKVLLILDSLHTKDHAVALEKPNKKKETETEQEKPTTANKSNRTD